jgi:surfeit locus 1 family protein
LNTDSKKPLPSWLPLIVGTVLVILFAGLGAWQISRGLGKQAERAAFSDATGFASWQDGTQVRPYEQIRVTGNYDNAHQILLENIILNGRYGYFVITPLLGEPGEPALLVNRGWIEKADETIGTALLEVPTTRITVRGRVGWLPRAGYKMGAAFDSAADWPKMAVYPDSGEVEAALGIPVQTFVLLMDAEEPHGFLREWVPTGFGPGKHFGYALQWFAMAVVLAALLTWNYRKKRFES